MKVCIAQPAYSTDYCQSDAFFEKQLELFAQCDSSMDIIVFPESCDIPCLAKSKEDAEKSAEKYTQRLLAIASATAKRCHSLLFVNARSNGEKGLRNTTYAFNRDGTLAGIYDKQHLTPGEVSKMKLDSDYSFEFSEPTVLEIEGIRFGFLICYDAYFYEMFPNMARQKLDVIIACSHQRSDTHQALTIMTQFLAYHTNAYVLRSSVSMGEDSPTGGASMVVAPTGEVLCQMGSRVGLETVDIDVNKKYYKPAGFGNPDAAHYEYIEQGRRPWKYRPAGSAIVPPDCYMPYPRVCAHRGFHTIAPENSMPAFGAAVAMGADEIEFDLWATKDGEIVSCHDRDLDRVSTGEGKIYEHTYDELLKYDFGIKYSEKFKGLKILKFEEILKKFACHTVMNIHIKTVNNHCEYDPDILQKIIALIDKYDCRKHVYFTSGNDNLLRLAQKLAPDITRCVGAGSAPETQVERALRYGCKKIQLFKGKFTQEMVDTARENNLICNVFWSNNPEEAKAFLAMGIHTILTDDYNLISQAIK